MTVSIETSQKLTPMMEQYRSIKKTLAPDTVLFFRLGDFYEMFFDDAVRCSEILDITLTGRDGGEAGKVPMCGIPHHAFHGYVRTLLDRNLKAAVCEQIGDPKAQKGIVERKITRIITPATYLDDENPTHHFEYLTAVFEADGVCALAFLDLGTGEFSVRQVPRDRFQSEITLLAPREVILPKSLADEKMAGFVRDGLNASLTMYEEWIFDADEAFRLLQDTFNLGTKQGVSFHDQPAAVSAAGAVLYYLKDHMHSSLGHVRLPALLESSEFMILDRQAQKSLELVTNLQNAKGGPTLLAVLDQTLTSMGARVIYRWLIQPLLDITEIEKRHSALESMVKESSSIHTLRSLFKGVKDMERTLSRLNYGVANARDLNNLREFLNRVPQILKTAQSFSGTLIEETLARIRPFPEVSALIAHAICDEPPLTVKDGGLIRAGFSKELDELKNISANGKNWILDFQKREAERTGIRNLKVKYSQVFGYTIEVSKSYLNLVPQDYTRRQTLANAERFIVPELKEWDEKISGAEEKIKALEYSLFQDVREKILKNLGPLQEMAKEVGVLDALSSLTLAALQKKWVKPQMVASGEILIEGGRHPVVEAMLPAGTFVENDAFLDSADNQLIVLTGPNMAGKSTYIRQTAQIVILAQMGSFVPAKSARIGIVDRVFTRIGASDDLARGESTFMVEMTETAHILQKATSRSLLILDEVGRGTSTFDGVSIAWAICEYLVQCSAKPRTLFATHYHELTQLEDHFHGAKNYNITVRETKKGITFLRKVVRGGSDRSYGIHVAKLAGIPQAVIQRASQILQVLESENTEATQIIEGKKSKGKQDKGQLPLFEWAGQNHPVLEELRNLGVEGLTPLGALNKISEWKERLDPSKPKE